MNGGCAQPALSLVLRAESRLGPLDWRVWTQGADGKSHVGVALRDSARVEIMGEPDRWKIDAQQRELDRVSEWIRAADAKVSIVAAIDIGMLAAVATAAASSGPPLALATIAIVLGGVFPAISLALASRALLPQLVPSSKSLIFFGTVAGLSTAEYESQLSKRTEEDYLRDLVAQSHINSTIATSKHVNVRKSTWCLLVGVLPWLIAITALVRA